MVELLADITTGGLEATVKRGLVNSLKSFINTSLNKIPNVSVDLTDVDPRQQDLVTAIQKMSGQLASGEAVTGTQDVWEAATRAGYNAMMVELDDMSPKAQGIKA